MSKAFGPFYFALISEDIFSPCLWSVFSFSWYCLLQKRSFLILMQFNFFLSWVMPLVLYLKFYFHTQGYLGILLHYLPDVLSFVLHISLWCILCYFFERCKIFIFFANWCPVVSALFVEKTVFAPLYCFCSFLKNQLTIVM